MGLFERYLSVWVGLAILGGIALGFVFPNLFSIVAQFEYARVNIAIAVLIWLMIYPMMVQIDFSSNQGCWEKTERFSTHNCYQLVHKAFHYGLFGLAIF